MADPARDHLEKQRDKLHDLRDLCDHVCGHCGFKLLTSSSRKPYEEPIWRFVATKVNLGQDTNTTVRIEARYTCIEPFPQRSQCFWWWGDAKAVDRFRNWADETAVALWEYRDTVSTLSNGKGHFRTLPTLCAVALDANLGDPPLVVERALFDVAALQPLISIRPTILPFTLRIATPPPSFHVLDISKDAPRFALDILDYLLGLPRLVVDVPNTCVHWNNHPDSKVTEVQVHIFDLLKQHLGKGPLTKEQMIALDPDLDGLNFNRTVTQLPKHLRSLVKSARGKGWQLKLD